MLELVLADGTRPDKLCRNVSRQDEQLFTEATT